MRILTISCYGYGNIGDNMYSEVFDYYLGSDYSITKLSDYSSFATGGKRSVVGYEELSEQEKKLVEKFLPLNFTFDALIIGGGGLIIANKLKASLNLPYYINLCMNNNIPIYIISCGIQGPVDNFKNDFSDWFPVFDYANLITLRSPKDLKLVQSVTYNENVFYFRDLGYLYPSIVGDFVGRNYNHYLTVIIAGPVNTKEEKSLNIIKNSEHSTVVLMNMGARTDDDTAEQLDNFPNEYFSKNIIKYYGCKNINKDEPSDLSPKKVVDIIANSGYVLTGRYHGMIFSRALGIPYDTLGMGTNKMLWEEPFENSDIQNDVQNALDSSFNNIKYLTEDIKKIGTKDKKLKNQISKDKKVGKDREVSDKEGELSVTSKVIISIVVIVFLLILMFRKSFKK